MIGFWCVGLASIFMVSKDVVSKHLAVSLKGDLSAFASFLFAMPWYIALLAMAWFLDFESFVILEGFLILVLARSITDSFAEVFRMQAFRYGELSQVSSFIALNPILLVFLEPVIVGDNLHGFEIFGILLSLVGGLVVLYQPINEISWKLMVYGFLAALFFALNSCFDRLAVGKSSPMLAAASMTLCSATILSPVLLRRGSKKSLGENIPSLFGRGFFELCFMVLKLSALIYFPASKVSAILRGSLVISIVAGAIFFKEKNFFRKMIGGVITAVGLWIAFSQDF